MTRSSETRATRLGTPILLAILNMHVRWLEVYRDAPHCIGLFHGVEVGVLEVEMEMSWYAIRGVRKNKVFRTTILSRGFR